MTLEEAQAQIVDLNERVTELTNERDSLSANNESMKTELESVRKLNQKYFEKLSAQNNPQAKETDTDPDPVSCEEFAKTIIL